MKNKFTEDDKKKTIEFLNFVANKAILKEVSVQESIEWFKLLSFMQQTLLPKLDANILEVLRVVEPKEENKSESDKKSE